MEILTFLLLFILVAVALSQGASRDEKIRRLEREQEELRRGIDGAHRRVAQLEQGMTEAYRRLDWLRAELEARPAAPSLPEAPAAPKALPARGAEAPAHEEKAAEKPAEAAPPIEKVPPAAAPEPAEVAPTPPEAAAAEPRAAATPPEAAAAEPAEQEAPPASAPRPAAAGPEIPKWSSPAAEPPVAAARVAEPAPQPRVEPRPAEPRPAEPPPPSAPPVRFDWERWVGVRGAAALGACVLVIAGLYFFKYSIEQGLISPSLRVVLGTLVGLGGAVGSEVMLRRRYTVLANWLAGAGVAILYTAFWAAHSAYGLIGSGFAFALMTLVTVACGLLALRHDAMVIALLGLLGGFVTPAAISTGEDHPFGLFGYLLMLDGALLYLSVKRRWAVLGALSLLGTLFYQVVWIGDRMGPERIGLGMGIVVVFGALYGVSLPEPRDDESAAWKITRAATVLLPYCFGLYFGLRVNLGAHLAPIGAMVAVLSAGAAWLGRAKHTAWMALAAAIADVAIVAAWLARHDQAGVAWEVAGVVGALALIFHAFRELERARPGAAGPDASANAAAVATLGGLFVLVACAAMPTSADPWPWLVGWVGLGALAIRQSLLGRPLLRVGVAALVSLGAPVVHAVHAEDAQFPAMAVYLGGIVAVAALALIGAALLRRGAPAPDSAKAALPAQRGRDEAVVLLPFVYAVYFAARVETGPHLGPMALLLLALAVAAVWAARAAVASAWIALVAAFAALAVLATWMGVHDAPAVAWEAAGAVLVVAAVHHAATEIRGPAPASAAWLARAAGVAAIGGAVLLLAVASGAAAHLPWAFIAGALALAGLSLRQAHGEGREPLHIAPAVVLGVGLPAVHGAHLSDGAFPSPAIWLALCVGVAIGVQALALAKPEGQGRRFASHGAALLALLLLVEIIESPAPPALVFAASLALLALALISATRLGHGGWSLAAALAGAFVHAGYMLAHVPPRGDTGPALIALAGQALAVVLIAAWPLAAAARFRADVWAWRSAALAGPLWFGSLLLTWSSAFGRGAVGLLPLGIGLVTAAVATRARAVLPPEGSVRKSALVWLFAITLCSVSLAIPLQLDNEWVTVGWALEGLALAALWKRMDHAGLKYTSTAHLAVVAVRLVMNPWVLDYHARAPFPVVNWLLYTYWIPGACLVGAWWLLRDLEAPRARAWESGLYAKGSPVLAVASAATAIVVFFVWINLTIFDAFGDGPELHLAFERMPARDLTLSLAWAIYALVLLGLGMARKSAALRWTSLALIIVTIGKVFLYDLSHLHDLYRVMSLVGLALSLILISLAYQKFVFGRRDDAASSPKK